MNMNLTDLTKLPIFPFADEFPYLSDEEMLELADDIEANGLHHPIVLFKAVDAETGELVEQVLDGRNRLRAAQKTKLTELPVEWYEGDDPIGKIISLNILRRQLEPGQLAAMAVVALPHIEAWNARVNAEWHKKQARTEDGKFLPATDTDLDLARAKHFRTSAALAGEKLGVGKTSVTLAKAVSLNAPDLFEKMKSGEMGTNTAYQEMKRRQANAPGSHDGTKAYESEPEKLAASFQERVERAFGNMVDAIKDYVVTGYATTDDTKYVSGILAKLEHIKSDLLP